MTVQLPAHLSEMINNLGVAAVALADEVRADREQRAAEAAADRIERKAVQHRQTTLLVIIAVLVFALAGLSVYNRLLGNQNRQVIASIESCTAPDGECAQRAQRRTDEVIGKLLRMNIEVAACSRGARTDTAYRQCIDAVLVELMGAPPSGAPPEPGWPVRPSPTPTR